MNHFNEHQQGITWVVALGQSSYEGVVGEAVGSVHASENLAGVVEITVVGDGGEAEEFGSGEWVSNLGGLDHLGMELLQVLHGFAWEERRWRP